MSESNSPGSLEGRINSFAKCAASLAGLMQASEGMFPWKWWLQNIRQYCFCSFLTKPHPGEREVNAIDLPNISERLVASHPTPTVR